MESEQLGPGKIKRSSVGIGAVDRMEEEVQGQSRKKTAVSIELKWNVLNGPLVQWVNGVSGVKGVKQETCQLVNNGYPSVPITRSLVHLNLFLMVKLITRPPPSKKLSQYRGQPASRT